MAKKKSAFSDAGVAEKANSALAKRLRELVTDTGALAEKLGCTVQAVNQYKQGTAKPQVDKLEIIADTYGVSVDYLLGRTDVASLDLDIANACAYTGLSEEAIKVLHSIATDIEISSTTISRIICHKDFYDAFGRIVGMAFMGNEAAMNSTKDRIKKAFADKDAAYDLVLGEKENLTKGMMYFRLLRYEFSEVLPKIIDDCCNATQYLSHATEELAQIDAFMKQYWECEE